MTWLSHISINTGHRARSSRDDVDPAALALCGQQLGAALHAGEAGVPMRPEALAHYTLTVTAVGRKLLATVMGPAGPHVPGRPWRGKQVPIVTIGVAPKSLDAAKLWPMMVMTFPVSGEPEPAERPGAPWVAVRTYPALATFADSAAWLGDFERCLAWAWLDTIKDASDGG